METPHPEERPHKKRRFFAEESSPIHVSPVRPASPQASVRSTGSTVNVNGGEDDNGLTYNGEDMSGFDVGTLQAIVGELPQSTLQKLQAVSGGDVQRGG